MASKRNKLFKEKVDKTRLYPFDEAIGLLKELANAKFSESIDVSVNLGVDPRKSDQVVRSSTVLPHGTGKTVRVAVFTQGANADAAREAGADIVGMDDLADSVKAGKNVGILATYEDGLQATAIACAASESMETGKVIEIELAETDREKARAEVEKMCETLLANTVIENYSIELV